MSIENLSLTPNANFHRLTKALADQDIVDLFKALVPDDVTENDILLRHIRKPQQASVWSAIAFPYKRAAAAFPNTALRETVVGYILMVERADHLAVFKSGLDLTRDFKDGFIGRIAQARLQEAIAPDDDSTFEKIRMRNLSPSKSVLRAKALEADDIASVVGAAGANRYAAQSFAVKRATGGRLATTLSTGRVGLRKTSGDYLTAIAWAGGIIDDIVGVKTPAAAFLRIFAQPQDLTQLTVDPVSFCVNVAALQDLTTDPEVRTHRLVKKAGEDWIDLAEPDLDELFPKLDTPRDVEIKGQDWQLKGGGKLVKSSQGIELSRLSACQGVFVRPVIDEAKPTKPVSLRAFINREDLFVVLFADPILAWISGTLFKDDAFAGADQVILKYMKTSVALKQATSEKGDFDPLQKHFSDASVFKILIDSIADQDTTLVCDDLGDEWADFIGIGEHHGVPVLTFYHAKHGEASLGASGFHVAVSQGIKNLGRLSMPKSLVKNKVKGWSGVYKGEKVTTQIPRIVRGGDEQAVKKAFEDISTAPEVLRRVWIVTSSLSYAAVVKELRDMKKRGRPEAHFVQLYWLLSSFFSACAEAGVSGSIVCEP